MTNNLPTYFDLNKKLSLCQNKKHSEEIFTTVCIIRKGFV